MATDITTPSREAQDIRSALSAGSVTCACDGRASPRWPERECPCDGICYRPVAGFAFLRFTKRKQGRGFCDSCLSAALASGGYEP